jgi:NAD(P)H-dependent flavin oxidoreductase YrpB (nitropropane dioxygenase family)
MKTGLLQCKYPIICAPMNQVSDLTLALAVWRTGCMPGLAVPNYMPRGKYVLHDKLEYDLSTFSQVTGGCNLLLATNSSAFKDPAVVKLIIKYGVTHIELYDIEDDSLIQKVIKSLRKLGVKMFYKRPGIEDFSQLLDYIDALIIKSDDAAGRVIITNQTLVEKIHQLRCNYPDLPIIAAGGVTSKSDVSLLIDAGAEAVSVGTLFAMSSESSIDPLVKLKLINTSDSHITQLSTVARSDMVFNAVKFSDIAQFDENHTVGLREGVANPESGHVYAGHAITTVKTIKTVQEIVNGLTS